MTGIATALKIRPGEERPAALAVGLMLAAFAGFGLGGSAVEALLFARSGVAVLPYLFMALAGLTLVTSLVVTALLGRVRPSGVYLSMPLVLAGVLAVERLLLLFDFDWLYPVMWLSLNVANALQGHFTWGLAGASLDTRQGKRLFPLFGAGSIVGTVLGGLVTPPLVGVLGSENLLVVWAALSLVVFLLGRALVAGASARSGPAQARPSVRLVDQIQQGLRYVRRSPMFTWLSFGAIAYALLYYSVTFPFARVVADAFPNEDALTGFIGLFQGLSTGVAFLLSLVVANRLYARFGLSNTILMQAGMYFVGFAALVAVTLGGGGGASRAAGPPPIFYLMVGFRFVQQAWIMGVTSPAYQALLNVAPPERRGQVRAFIEGVPQQTGILLAGAVLLVGEQALRPEHLFAVGLGAAVLGGFTVWRMALAYGGELVEALRAGHHHVFYEEDEPFGGFQHDAAAISAAVVGLSNTDAVVRRVAAETLGNLAVPQATGALVQALADPDSQVRANALRALGRARAAPALLDVALCLDDPEPEVRLQAVETLCRLAGYPGGVLRRLRPLLADPAPLVRAQAALELLRLGPDPEARDLLRNMAAIGDSDSRICALRALGEWGDAEAFGFVRGELEDRAAAPVVRRAAATALARIDAGRAIGDLVQALGDDDRTVREAAAEALGRAGKPALDPVVAALFSPETEAGALLALEHLPAHEAAQAIRAYSKAAGDKALRYHDAWRHIETHDGLAGLAQDDPRVRLLAGALRGQALRHGGQALEAAGLLTGRDAMALALEGLASADSVQRANALESLEALDGRWRETVRPLLRLWESAEPAPAGHDGAAGPDHLRDLLADPDDWVRACATLAAAGAVNEFGDVLTRLAQDDPDAVVRETAQAALLRRNGGQPVQTLPTLPVMERILLLRRVPIFADLSPADLKQVASIAGERLYPDGETIAREGESGEELYVIASGEVRVIDPGNGAELARRAAGGYVGEMSIISREPRMASLVAAGDTRLLCLGRLEFEGILRERPEASLAVMRELISRLREASGGRGRGE